MRSSRTAEFIWVASAAGGRALSHLRQIRTCSGTSGARAGRRALEFRRLGNDVFNELGWLDPSGHLIRLVEARTFSPCKRAATEMSLCGYFAEIALPSAELRRAKEYWEKLGFVGMDELEAPLPHVSCTSDSIDIGTV